MHNSNVIAHAVCALIMGLIVASSETSLATREHAP